MNGRTVASSSARSAVRHDCKHQPARQRAVRVLEEGAVVGVVVQPRGPEQVALLAARRVERPGVEEPVQFAEGASRLLDRLAQRLGALAQVAQRLADLAGERPDLVLDRAQALPSQALRGDLARRERLRRRDQRLGRRAKLLRQYLTALERRAGLGQRGGQLLQRLAQVRLLGRERREYLVLRRDEVRQAGIAAAERLGQVGEAGDRAADVRAPLREPRVDARQVAAERLEAPQARRQLLAAASEALRTALDQERQVVARVAVERREDLVEVHVRLALRERDRVPLLDDLARFARVELHGHVLQPRARAHQDRGVLVDQLLVRPVDAHGHDRAPVLELDLPDVADLDARHVHRLALTRRDGLRGRDLDLQLELVVAQERDPGRVRLALLREDHAGHGQADHDQRDDRDEVPQVLPDRAPHGAATRSDGPAAAAGPLMLGGSFW